MTTLSWLDVMRERCRYPFCAACGFRTEFDYRTFAEDIHDIEPARTFLRRLIDKLWSYSVANRIRAKTVTLKVKFADFNQITRSKTIGAPVVDVRELASLVDVLLTPVFPTDKGIRLLGVILSSLERSSGTTHPQLLLSLD